MKHWLMIVIILLISSTAICAGELPTSQWHVNSIGMKLVQIEPGTFEMGQKKILGPETSVSGLDFTRTGDFDEHPVHRVKISKAFYMGIVEVTNLQYETELQEEKRRIRYFYYKLGFWKSNNSSMKSES